jgi:putative protease
MELLVNPTSYANALTLIELGVHQIFIGDNQFCVRNNCHVTLQQIKKLVESKKNTKILVLINRFFFDPELPKLEEYLIALNKIKIDGIIFNDFAVNQICHEKKILIPLTYNPETLVTNYEQFPFYLQNNIQEVSLARELNFREIQEIGANKNEMKVQIQVSGCTYMMHSRWKLISNFKQTQNISDELFKTKLLIREISRNEPCIIYEDESGTHVLSKYSLNLIDYIYDLHRYKVDTIRIDSFLHDET